MRLIGIILLGLARLSALVGLLAAGAWSFRVAVADHLARVSTSAALQQAIAWCPIQSQHYIRLAAIVSDADPVGAMQLLQRSVELNPLDSRTWIELGLRREINGDLAAAEYDLLHAAEIDRQYLPRWTLTNFYFRRGDVTHFWQWARKAVSILQGDPSALFGLCGEVAKGENLIERLAVGNADIRAYYLGYVLAQNQTRLIYPVAQRIGIDGRQSDVALLLTACDRLLQMQNVEQASLVWNVLAASRRIPHRVLTSALGANSVTNGTFSLAPSSHGFDWRTPDIGGIGTVREDEAGGLRLTFSGKQPESCSPLSQFISVRENALYFLEYVYTTLGLSEPSGLSWNIEYTDAIQASKTTADVPTSQSEESRRIYFRTPPRCHLVRLDLEYRRAPGTVRRAGRMVLKRVLLHLIG